MLVILTGVKVFAEGKLPLLDNSRVTVTILDSNLPKACYDKFLATRLSEGFELVSDVETNNAEGNQPERIFTMNAPLNVLIFGVKTETATILNGPECN